MRANFSEGRDLNVIRQITDAIAAVEGVSLLDVDPGASTNRTVVTFVGSPEAAVEGAFRGIQKAAELIDMRKQKGAHPRMGATDVCPFIPVSDVSWEEAIACAQSLGKRVAAELEFPSISTRRRPKIRRARIFPSSARANTKAFSRRSNSLLEAGFRSGCFP
jgi:glutamate formiminotransferase/formiminotetrahydrofolate cyclodeaminase